MKNYFLTIVILIILFETLKAQTNPGLGIASEFTLLTKGQIIANNFIVCNGNVSGNLINQSNLAVNDGIVYAVQDTLALNATSDLVQFRNYADSGAYQNINIQNSNTIFNQGFYDLNTITSIKDTITLVGDSSSIFFFRIHGQCTIETNFLLTLNDVRPQNIFWILNDSLGSINIKSDVSFSGIVVSKGNVTSATRNAGWLTILSDRNININLYNDNINNFNNLFSAQMMAVNQLALTNDMNFCATEYKQRIDAQNNPNLQKQINDYEKVIQYKINQNANKLSGTSEYVIPVVFHLVYSNTLDPIYNITPAQLDDQINWLNKYFSNDVGLPLPAENMHIKFCKASIAPPGLTFSFPGITDHQSQETFTDMTSAKQIALKSLGYCDANKYLNIWVVTSISNGNPNAAVLGYASFPNGTKTLDGIVMRYDYLGNNATCNCSYLAPDSKGKILAHEVGHYLDIYHTFHGSACSGQFQNDCSLTGDFCCDTPPVANANTGCTAINSCNETYPAPLFDQIENHMDYTNEQCRVLFTGNQRDRMCATLTTARSLLISAQNLIDVGVGTCMSITANFSASPTQICTNEMVTFNAVYPNAVTYSWDFGDNSTLATGISVTHIYQNAGNFTLTLTISDGTNNYTGIKTHLIYVDNCNPIYSTKGSWYFGSGTLVNGGSALSFVSGTPQTIQPLPHPMNAIENAVSISDVNGDILFFANSEKIFDKNHNQVSPSLLGNISTSQSIVIPDPNSPNTTNPSDFYYFYMPDYGAANLYYAKIHIDGNGNATVNSSNNFISMPNHLEAITAVPHCNGIDFWMILHTKPILMNNYLNEYYVYQITQSGFINSPFIYNSSITDNGVGLASMKASPYGSKIAITIIDGTTEICDFDKSTGVISNPQTIQDNGYGLSFSSKSRFLYISSTISNVFQPYSEIFQYDLQNNLSKSFVTDVTNCFNLQLAPNNKIYASKWIQSNISSPFLDVINYPDNLNTDYVNNECGFNTEVVDLNAGNTSGSSLSAYFSLPNFMDALMPNAVVPDFTYTVTNCTTYTFTAIQCRDPYSWDFGDNNTGTGNPVTHSYTASGTYTVTVTMSNGVTVTHNITVGIANAPIIGGQTSVCDLSKIYNYSVNAINGLTYNWTATGGNPASVQNANNIDVTWNAAGPHVITLTAIEPQTGCSRTAILNVNLDLVSITPAPTGQYCAGSSLYINANFTGPHTLLWSTGQNVNPISVSSPGTYTLTCTNATGCIATLSTLIIANPLPAVSITGAADLCNGTTQVYSVVPAGNYTYNWTVQGGTNIGISNNQIAIDWANLGIGAITGGTVTVTVTNNLTGCSAVFNLDVAACCTQPGVTNYQNPTYSNSTTTGQTFIINGTATINGNVNFNGCTIYMGPLAKIILNSNSNLNLDNTHIMGCAYMWKGVYLDEDNEQINMSNNSIIEDAINGLNVTHNGQFHITNSTFNKNYIHIKANCSGLNSFVNTSTFDCNVGGNFNCLIPPYNQKHTFRAFDLTSCQLTIGNPLLGNDIKHCDIGLLSYQSKSISFNNHFSDIFAIGIYAYSDGALTVENQNSFVSIPQAIVATQYVHNVNISHNYFDNLKTGVMVYKNPNVNITLDDNRFTNNAYAAILNSTNLGSHQTITRNIISNNISVLSYGIAIVEPTPDPTSTYTIEYNETNNIYQGITCSMLEAPSIRNNYCYVLPYNNSNATPYGIGVFKCTNANIWHNTVTSDAQSIQYYWSNGIMVDNSPGATIICNSAGNIGRGFWIGGITNGTFAGNSMYDCYDQFLLNWCPLGLGDQGIDANINPPCGFPFDNEWVGNYVHAQTYSYNSNSINANGATNFYVRQGLPYEPNANLKTGILALQVGITSLCYPLPPTEPLYCNLVPFAFNDNRAMDLAIAANGFNWTDIAPFKWMAKQYFYEKSDNDASYTNSEIIFQNQHDSLAQTNIAEIKVLGDSIVNILSDSIEQHELNELIVLANSIYPSDGIEQYYKSVYKIYLKTINIIGYNYTPAQLATLRLIAGKCPYEFGPAVYAARNMLIGEDTSVVFYNACNNFGYGNAKQQANNTDLHFKITPNPSKEFWTIQYQLTAHTQSELLVTDLSGRILYSKILPMEVGELKVSNEARKNGAYIVKIKINGVIVFTERLFVIK